MQISLPADIEQWLRAQAAKAGHSTDEFVLDLLRREQALAAREKIDDLLGEAMASESTPMTQEDWDHIRAEGRRRLDQQKSR